MVGRSHGGPRQPRSARRRRHQGGRAPGVKCIDGVDHDRAVVRAPHRRRQGGSETALLSRVPRDQVPHRRTGPLVSHAPARGRRAAGVPQPHKGPRRRRLLHRVRRPRRGGAVVRRRRATLRGSPLPLLARWSLHRTRGRRRARRGQHLGSHRRSFAARPRQGDVDRRRQPPEPRPGGARDEGTPADEVLRGVRLARRGSEVRPTAAGSVPTARRELTAPAHRCDAKRGVPGPVCTSWRRAAVTIPGRRRGRRLRVRRCPVRRRSRPNHPEPGWSRPRRVTQRVPGMRRHHRPPERRLRLHGERLGPADGR